MRLEDKIKKLCDLHGCISNKHLAEFLGLNHVVFNRNIREENLTGDMIKAIAQHSSVDLNWLLRDSNINNEIAEKGDEYLINPEKKLDEIIKELNILKKQIARK